MSHEHAGLACRRDPHRRTGSDERTPMPIAYLERPRQRQAQSALPVGADPRRALDSPREADQGAHP